MFKSLVLVGVLTVIGAQAALASHRHGGCCCSAAPATAAPATSMNGAPAPAVAQATQANRSFSYEPVPLGGNYGVRPYYNRPQTSYGLRPASSKIMGNY